MRVEAESDKLLSVSDEEERQRASRGAAIEARFNALGISDREWYRLTGIDRKTLNRAMAGELRVRQSTLTTIEAVLDKLEAKNAGVPQEEPEQGRFIEFEVKGMYGAKSIIVKGPVEDRDALIEAVQRLLRGSQEQGDNS